uniref:Uncharacterized protein n=1 Tax=Avena sativa TaxID=4498 RepID=A0ACD5WPD6_AVESA
MDPSPWPIHAMAESSSVHAMAESSSVHAMADSSPSMADPSPPIPAANPNWMMLERFVFRMDDVEPFPDDDDPTAPLYRIDDDTFPGDPFSVAFRIARPPKISRLFLKWPRGPKPGSRCVLVAAHRNLLLLSLIPDSLQTEETRYTLPVFVPQRLFICTTPSCCLRYDLPDSPPPPLVLRSIPMCSIPVVLRVKKNGKEVTMDRRFQLETVGILSRAQGEFAIAQLVLCRPSALADMEAELCVLRSSINNHEHSWEVEKGLPISYESDEFFDLDAWSTHRVVPFNNALCWVNYGIGGLLICEVFHKRPTLLYLRLPILNRKLKQRRVLDRNSALCVTKADTGVQHDLVFIDIVRKDEYLAGPLSPHTGFTVSYHILRKTDFGGMEWKMTCSFTSAELWDLNKSLPHEALTFPQVSMDNPDIVFFLMSKKGEGARGIPNVSVVTVDISKTEVLSVVPYFGENDISGKDTAMVLRRSGYLESFLPSELPKLMNTICFGAAAPTPGAAARATPQVNINTAIVADCPASNTRRRKKIAM